MEGEVEAEAATVGGGDSALTHPHGAADESVAGRSRTVKANGGDSELTHRRVASSTRASIMQDPNRRGRSAERAGGVLGVSRDSMYDGCMMIAMVTAHRHIAQLQL